LSERSRFPFFTITFDSVSEGSAESVLFGSSGPAPAFERMSSEKNLLEAAEGGTLYIKGLTEMSAAFQEKIGHIGSRHLAGAVERPSRAGVRILIESLRGPSAGPDRDEIEYCELMGVTGVIRVPPLRERRQDIEPLARHFIRESCIRTGKETRQVTGEMIGILEDYAWPGNVVELKRVIDHMVHASSPPVIGPSLLPAYLVKLAGLEGATLPPEGIDLNGMLEAAERSLVCSALRHCNGVQRDAARFLGIKPTTLNMKMLRFGIKAREFRRLDRGK